ncbi:MAG: endonuclease/exonuclease/phosphatase family protein [Gemmatimonadota bacterium]
MNPGRLLRAAPLLVLLLAGCSRTAALAPPTLRVLVYNIHAGKDAQGVENLERVAAVVRDADADLVLLQEVDRGTARSGGVDQIARLAEATGLHAAFGRTLDYDGGEYGIALLSRFPLASDTLVHLPVDPPQARAGGSYEPRGILEARVSTPWGPLLVLNTHLDASPDDAYRWQEVPTVLARGRDAATAADDAVLLGGDFNAEPGTRVIDAPAAAGWVDAFAGCGRGDGLTYPANGPIKRIDYLWLGEAFECVEAEVLTGEASDHRAFRVDLRWRGRAAGT